ncbi:MAG: PKD domain-containing protein [Bacteroidota bacterium]
MIYRLSIALLLTTFWLLPRLDAQEEVFIFGPEFLCPFECGEWFIEFPTSDNFTYQWDFYQGGLNEIPYWSTTTEGYSPVGNCVPNGIDFEPGWDYQIVVTASTDGNVVASGEFYFFVGFENELVGEAYGAYLSACEQDSIALTFPNFQSDCREVCSGSTSTILLDQIFVYTSSGEIFTLTGDQGDWSVVGGTATSIPNGIEITWGPTGSGRATFNFFTNSQCFEVGTIDFCFDIIPSPEAGFTTQPPPNANGVVEVCEGQAVFFFAETTDAESYLWDFGDGGGSSNANPTHIFNGAGNYEVQLITGTSCECTDTSRVTVIVEGNETPFIDCVGTICEGTSVTYTANTGCSSYGWDISSNGTVLDGGSSSDDFITIQWGAGPIGEITLETSGCPDLSACTAAAYLQVPIVSASATMEGPERVCPGDESTYSVPPFEGTSFNWSVGSFGTIVSGQGTPTIVVEWFDGFIPNESQPVSVDYSNCYLECGGSASLDVRILPEFFLTGEIEVCENSTVNYAVNNTQTSVGFPANYSILDGANTVVFNSSAPSDNIDIDWAFAPGEYTLVAVPSNPLDFCLLNATLTITVLPEPAAVTAIDGQTDICPGIAYTYAVADPVDGERYRWRIDNGGNTSEREGATIAVEWAATGPYTLSVTRLTPPLFCESAPTTANIGPVSGFVIAGDDQVCVDQLAAYTSDQTGDVYYEWSVLPASAGTIAEDPTAETIEVLWHSPGPATVSLNICGQTETFAVVVNAPPLPVVNAPAALCLGVTQTVSTVLTYAGYSWQDEAGNEIATIATPDLGGGYYRLEVTDDLGCVGMTTFQIYEYPSSNISISTPDFSLFCNLSPFTRMYAVNTEDGYTYQWYQDGSALPGETGTSYTATTFGNYYVEIVDENGCTFASNTIEVQSNCTDIRCDAAGAGCPNPSHSFTLMENGSCDNRAYTALAAGADASTVFWNFDDPDSGANNSANGINVSHEFTKPGFYRVLMGALYDDGMGGQVLCRTIIPDTVYAVADFDYDGVCPGLPVQFYDLSTFLELTSIVAWDWDFGDPASGANTTTDKDPLHTFSSDGDYQVTLTVTTANGCTATVTETVSIFPLPFTEFAEPDITCELTTVPFVANVEATVSDVSWNFGDPTSGDANTSTLFESFHEYASVGTYTVSLDATSVYGCSNSFTRNIDITANTLAGQIDPPGVSTLCEGDNLTLNAPTAEVTQWTWSNEEGTAAITVNTAEAYSVTLTSAEGCTYVPDAVLVDIIPAPQSPIRSVTYDDFGQPENYVYETITICEGEDIFLETEQQTDYAYNWSTGDMDTNTEFSEARGNQLAAGTHVISLTVTNTVTNCSAEETFTVEVNPSPAIPVIASAGGSLCAGTATTLSVSNPQGSLIYIWSNGDVGPSITTDEAAEYYVTAINSTGCRAESETVEILAGPDISLVPSGCHTRCAPDTLCLPTIPNVVSYQWYQDGTLIPAPDGTVGELIITQSGSYTLEMEDVNGCTQTTEPLTIDLLPGFGTIQGLVYYDLNDNQVIDPADSLAGGITVLLDNPNGSVGTVTTPINGNYGFVDVPEADYTVAIDTLSVPENWTPLVPSVDTTFTGCDQEVLLDWLLVPDCSFDTTFTMSICPDEVFELAGQQYPVGTATTVNLSNALGCDSTFNFTVAALPTSSEVLGVELCAGETFNYDGQSYGPGTDQLFTFTNSSGCDSVVQLQIVATSSVDYSVEALASCPNGDSGSLTVTPGTTQGPLVYALDGNPFQATGIFTTLAPGDYDLTIEDDNGCQYAETVNIAALPSLVVDLASPVLVPCDSSSIQLTPNVISGDFNQLVYSWNDGASTLNRSVSQPGSYILSVSNACEQQQLSVEVESEFLVENDLIYVPNVFSPNNDGRNDEFQLFPSPYVNIQALDFQVFDRWGSMVFDAANGDDRWRGTIRGREAKTGVYVWRLEANVNICGQQRDLVQQGEILLVR